MKAAPKQLHGDFYAIGDKFDNTEDQNRYTNRVALACTELMETEQYQCGDYNSRPKLFASDLPLLAKKYRVKLKRLEKIFEV